MLAYTNDSPDVAIPATWDDADPHLIDRGKVEQVRLRSFSTNVHSLEVRQRLRSNAWLTAGDGRIQGWRVDAIRVVCPDVQQIVTMMNL